MESLISLSNSIADIVDAVAPSVVQVQGRRRPASGLVCGDGAVLTLASVLGRNDGLHVRTHDGHALDAQLAGWDPATSLAVLQVDGLKAPALSPSSVAPRVGHIAIAVARSWSNVVTATSGLVSIIGGPLRTWRRTSIEQIIRTSAPMHDGFAGGAFLDASGTLIGVTTASAIRGLGIVIPASIAWQTAAALRQHGHVKRGYLGIASQPVRIADPVQAGANTDALLVTHVTPGSPAEGAGVLVGDVILEVDGRRVESPEDLLDLLTGDRIGTAVALQLRRGGAPVTVTITIGERLNS
ncbi:MAG TPA: trypsin-like peptidase domain-containing protein [Vicinamibacterales bacterium]|nr:trypsin-like peptidase domain-containing protein [Vicinamibacterales bacterium]